MTFDLDIWHDDSSSLTMLSLQVKAIGQRSRSHEENIPLSSESERMKLGSEVYYFKK